MNKSLLLILSLFGFFYSFGQTTVLTPIQVQVKNVENMQPITNASVLLVSIINAIDIHIDTAFTDNKGYCSFSLSKNDNTSYSLRVKKEGFFDYLGEDALLLYPSFIDITENSENQYILYLTSDALNHEKYWEKNAVRLEMDSLIGLLKTNRYPQELKSRLPLLFWEDIPYLLEIADDTTLITQFPHYLLSSFYQKECEIGTIALWFIESIRLSEEKGIKNPMEKFPSLNPILYRSNQVISKIDLNDTEKLQEAAKAYRDWWNMNQEKPKKEASLIDPLESVPLKW